MALPSLQSAETLRDQHGNRMRGTPMTLGKPLRESVAHATDIENWKNLTALGLNTVRVCWVDPWYRRHNEDYWSVQEVLPYLDACVENATATGINLIVNYHNVGEYEHEKGYGQMEEFWLAVASRYKDNPLVYYEINNEQAWYVEDYTDPAFMETMERVYTQVRQDAPERHIIFFSFHSLSLDYTAILEAYTWIDWDITTVGFHLYGWEKGDRKEEEAHLLELIQNYRTICTEWDYPERYDYIKEFFDHRVNAQALEALGISWTDWSDWHDNSRDFIQNILIPDAEERGYQWWSENGK